MSDELIAAPSQPMGLTLEQDLVVEAVLKHAPEIRQVVQSYSRWISVSDEALESFARTHRALLVAIATDLRGLSARYPECFGGKVVTQEEAKAQLDAAGMPVGFLGMHGLNWLLLLSIYQVVLEHKDELIKAGQTIWEVVQKLYEAAKN